MTGSISKILKSVERLLNDRLFDEALVVLGGIDAKSISPSETAYYNLLYVEINLYLENYQVTDRLDEALEFYRGSVENNRFARAKFLSGWLLTARGEFCDAEEALLESYVHYKRCENYKGEARALNRLSYVKYIMGDVQAAMSRLETCLEIYDKIGDEENKSIVAMNLAQLYFASGELARSIRQYDDCREMILKRGTWNQSAFYNMSAIPYALKGDIPKAKDILNKARQYYGSYPREQAIYYENLGWIYLLEENYPEAETALSAGLEISLEIAPKSALISQIKRRLADACFGLNKFDRAKSLADEALAVAEGLNERVEIAACYRIYARLESLDGNYDIARTWYQKAIEKFTMIGARYELAVTRYLAAISGLYHSGERQALLFMAREYFAGEEVTHFIARIDTEIENAHNIPTVKDINAGAQGAPVIIAVNERMKRLINLARHVAPSKMSVLLTGPTGTGKDLLARYIHHYSGRTGQFISVNSAAIPDSMTEAELFGHRKGSFTGSQYDKEGLIEVASGGTLYLNEIAESSMEFQSKLLDVLENKKIRRLGETEEREVDFRLIAATNHDLEDLVRNGKFRDDLYHRLREIPITLPPLSERREDIPALLEYFLRQSGMNGADPRSLRGFDHLARMMSSFYWTGNVREFKSEVDRLVLLGKGDLVRMAEIAHQNHASEQDQLLLLLNQTNWNRSQVAKILGIAEGTVRHRIKKYNLTRVDESD